MNSTSSNTRSVDSSMWLLGIIFTPNDKTIKSTRLPTTKQILLCFLAHQESSKTTTEAAN